MDTLFSTPLEDKTLNLIYIQWYKIDTSRLGQGQDRNRVHKHICVDESVCYDSLSLK